jgi:hypothetical protein
MKCAELEVTLRHYYTARDIAARLIASDHRFAQQMTAAGAHDVADMYHESAAKHNKAWEKANAKIGELSKEYEDCLNQLMTIPPVQPAGQPPPPIPSDTQRAYPITYPLGPIGGEAPAPTPTGERPPWPLPPVPPPPIADPYAEWRTPTPTGEGELPILDVTTPSQVWETQRWTEPPPEPEAVPSEDTRKCYQCSPGAKIQRMTVAEAQARFGSCVEVADALCVEQPAYAGIKYPPVPPFDLIQPGAIATASLAPVAPSTFTLARAPSRGFLGMGRSIWG